MLKCRLITDCPFLSDTLILPQKSVFMLSPCTNTSESTISHTITPFNSKTLTIKKRELKCHLILTDECRPTKEDKLNDPIVSLTSYMHVSVVLGNHLCRSDCFCAFTCSLTLSCLINSCLGRHSYTSRPMDQFCQSHSLRWTCCETHSAPLLRGTWYQYSDVALSDGLLAQSQENHRLSSVGCLLSKSSTFHVFYWCCDWISYDSSHLASLGVPGSTHSWVRTAWVIICPTLCSVVINCATKLLV